jgi:peroxiredoxin Q/BCP
VRSGGIVRERVEGEEVVLTRDLTTARWTFIIGLDGKIVYKDTEVDAGGDSKAVLAAIERLTTN